MSTTTTLQTQRYTGPPLWAMCGPQRILLRPTRTSLLLLCPLMSTHKPVDPLSMPPEVWTKVFIFAMEIDEKKGDLPSLKDANKNYVTVCKAFKVLATPILYANPKLSSHSNLLNFASTLLASHQQWDCLRRIPYSTPGRWVTSLDISHLSLSQTSQRLQLDSALSRVFPLIPFLSKLTLNPNLVLSRRALSALRDSCGPSLKMITGLGVADPSGWPGLSDPITTLLTNTPRLEVLEIQGGGVGDLDEEQVAIASLDSPQLQNGEPLNLPFLHTLSLVAAPHADVFTALMNAPLPVLEMLTLTSYHQEPQDDQAATVVALGLGAGPGGAGLGVPPFNAPPASTSLFLNAHGHSLERLVLLGAPDWPPVPFTPPSNTLQLAPKLQHLALYGNSSSPLLYGPSFDKLTSPHPLKTVVMSRPPPGDDMLWFFEECVKGKARETGLRVGSGTMASGQTVPVRLFTSTQGTSPTPNRALLNRGSRGSVRPPPTNTTMIASHPSDLKGRDALLPNLHTIQFTSVKWMRIKGARDAGHSGGMKQWKMLLRRWGVRVLDQFGHEE